MTRAWPGIGATYDTAAMDYADALAPQPWPPSNMPRTGAPCPGAERARHGGYEIAMGYMLILMA
jgi:hypothetical protein